MLKNFTKLILLVSLFASSVNAETFQNFNVVGNERVSAQTIINFSNLNVGSDLSENDLKAMGSRGRLWMERDFSWDRIAILMEEGCKWLLDGGKPPVTIKIK